MNALPTLCLFVRDFLCVPLVNSAPDTDTRPLLRVPNPAVPATPWAELHGRVVAAARDAAARPFCFALDDGTAVCECVWFAPPVDAAARPVVGAFVLCRGLLRTADRLARARARTPVRQLSVATVRPLSPAGDHLMLARADREAMRLRYGLG